MDAYDDGEKREFITRGGYDLKDRVRPYSIYFFRSRYPGHIGPRASWFEVELDGYSYAIYGHILYSHWGHGGEIEPLFTLVVASRFVTDICYGGVEDWKDKIPGKEENIGRYENIVSAMRPPSRAVFFDEEGEPFHPQEPPEDTLPARDEKRKGETKDGW